MNVKILCMLKFSGLKYIKRLLLTRTNIEKCFLKHICRHYNYKDSLIAHIHSTVTKIKFYQTLKNEMATLISYSLINLFITTSFSVITLTKYIPPGKSEISIVVLFSTVLVLLMIAPSTFKISTATF